MKKPKYRIPNLQITWPKDRPTKARFEELLRQSQLSVIAVDRDESKVAALRERLHHVGLYGTRASVHVGDPLSYPFPPYLANLIVYEIPSEAGRIASET